MKNLLVILVLTLSLEGCFFVAGAAAGAAGVAVVYDHRKLEKIAADQHLATAIAKNLTANDDLMEHSHINVTCFNQVTLLTGETTTPEYRKIAGEIAQATPDTSRVYNQITIKGPTSSLTRASDSWITAKIKTEMLATEGLKSGTIKVVTENGTVYLMGIVTADQADMAVDIAREVSGVQRVIKIFQYKNNVAAAVKTEDKPIDSGKEVQ